MKSLLKHLRRAPGVAAAWALEATASTVYLVVGFEQLPVTRTLENSEIGAGVFVDVSLCWLLIQFEVSATS